MMSSKALIAVSVLVFTAGSVWYTTSANAQAVTDGLISYWSVDKNDIEGDKVKDVWGDQHATMVGAPKIVEGKVGDALKFDGVGDYLEITDNIGAAKLPGAEMTAEVWVYPGVFLRWGGYIAACRDNADFEKGWVLGTREPNKFSLAISSAGADDGNGMLTYLATDSSYSTDEWYHVVGTYDGVKMSIYVNGELDGVSEQQSKEINYPDKAFYVIAAYKDDDEFFPHNGVIDEIRVYDRALSEDEVLQNYSAKGLAVEAVGKLSLTWGKIKASID